MEDLNQLKLVLVKKKKTNKWLAEQLNVNQTTVSKWCTYKYQSARFSNTETHFRIVGCQRK